MTEQTLLTLKKGEVGTVRAVLAEDAMRRRFYDIGCIEGAKLRMIGTAPLGGPRAYAIAGAIIAIRKKDAETVRIRIDIDERNEK